MILGKLAPSTFRMLISLVRCYIKQAERLVFQQVAKGDFEIVAYHGEVLGVLSEEQSVWDKSSLLHALSTLLYTLFTS